MVTLLSARLAVPVFTQDERLSSREAEERLSLREKDWRKRKAKLDAAAAAVILQDYLDARSSSEGEQRATRRESETGFLFLAWRWLLSPRLVSLARFTNARASRSRATTAPSSSSTIEPGSGTRTIGQRLIEAGVIRNDATFRAALLAKRARAQPAGRRVSIRPANDAHRRHRQDRARRRLQPAHHVSRGAQHSARWRASTSSRGSARPRLSSTAARDASAIRDIDPAATDLEGYLFPDTYSVPRDRQPRNLSA